MVENVGGEKGLIKWNVWFDKLVEMFREGVDILVSLFE